MTFAFIAASERDFQVNLKLIKESRLKLNNLEFQYCRLALEFSNCFGKYFKLNFIIGVKKLDVF